MGRPGGGGARAVMPWLSGGRRRRRGQPPAGPAGATAAGAGPAGATAGRASPRPLCPLRPRALGALRAATASGPESAEPLPLPRRLGGGARLRQPSSHRPQHAPDVVIDPATGKGGAWVAVSAPYVGPREIKDRGPPGSGRRSCVLWARRESGCPTPGTLVED